jgi:C-terminal processing protease CtpA/Prc
MGFGLRIAETEEGHKIKEIMDQERCLGLRERDLVISINGQNVKELSHEQVVELLKNCPKNSYATFVVERRLDRNDGSGRGQEAQRPVQTVFSQDVYDDEDQNTVITKEVLLHRKQEGFGLRLVGGSEEGTQICIESVIPGGAADESKELEVGDQILAVNGLSCVMATHHYVVGLLGEAGRTGEVTIRVQRKVQTVVNEDRHNVNEDRYDVNENRYNVNEDRYIVNEEMEEDADFSELPDFGIGVCDVVLERPSNSGFGFVLLSNVDEAGCIIGQVVPGSPADLCEGLNVGDLLLAVNGKDVTRLQHADIVEIVKRSGLRVTLTVAPGELVVLMISSLSVPGCVVFFFFDLIVALVLMQVILLDRKSPWLILRKVLHLLVLPFPSSHQSLQSRLLTTNL